MSGRWAGSTRRSRLPRNWDTDIRPRVLRRDGYRCTWTEDGPRCRARATDVDHINPGDDHSLENLTSLCGPHHAIKSAREGGRAAAARRAEAKLPAEPHPGMLP